MTDPCDRSTRMGCAAAPTAALLRLARLCGDTMWLTERRSCSAHERAA
jgi:hypothetical protein